MDCDQSQSSNLESSTPIPVLPKEMLEEIFERLPFRDVLKCREVHSTWKRAATHPLRKRCAPLDFCRRKYSLWTDQMVKATGSELVQSFVQLIRATYGQGGLGEFPVTEFQLTLNSDYFWIQMDGCGCALIRHLLKAVRSFAKKITFNLALDFRQMPNNNLEILQALTFPNPWENALKKYDCQDTHSGISSSIGDDIEESRNIKQLELHGNHYNMLECIEETGILQNSSLVTSFNMKATFNETALQYLNELELGFKLKYFLLNLSDHRRLIDSEKLNKFLKSQSDTLTSLTLSHGKCNHWRDLPCLPHLKNLSIQSEVILDDNDQVFKLPTSFYKTQLPALKKLEFTAAPSTAHYFMANHLAPSESLQELILLKRGIIGADVIQQAARLFPNLKKIQVYHQNAECYMRKVYEMLTGIEELSILTDDYFSVDDLITGLPKRILRRSRNETPPCYQLQKAVAMLELGTIKTLACLKNLKTIVVIHRLSGFAREKAFGELSGIVLKQMKSLRCIEFCNRENMPIDNDLRQDLESHGIKLFWGTRPCTNWRTGFFDDSCLSFE